jgi:hypothetical protein
MFGLGMVKLYWSEVEKKANVLEQSFHIFFNELSKRLEYVKMQIVILRRTAKKILNF